jgi:hypothetical protein
VKLKYSIILLINVLLVGIAYAQPSNADCTNPISIPNPTDWCSSVGQFTNVNAGASGYGAAACWDGVENDVWFEFTAVAKTVSITVIGQNSGGGTLQNPEVALYVANGCTGVINELRCASDVVSNDIISIVRGGLVIGQSLYIRVDGRSAAQGSFQLCIVNYNPPTEPGQDCNTASILCDKSTFVVESVIGSGLDSDEASGSCLGTFGDSESSSTWFKWTCKESGTLTFVLDPIRKTPDQPLPGDDLDFALYELVEGIDKCGVKSILRCNATHPFRNGTLQCNYQTGLDLTSTDTEEDSNCDAGEDGFVRFIDMVAGKSYALLVNNFTPSEQGFEISFGGTGTFLGPEPDFLIEPLQGLRCDTFFTISDLSSFSNGNIVGWEWNFGKDAIPAGSNSAGPHQVIYDSFGKKSIVLTVTSDKGCLVTEIIDIDVEPCCQDTSTLSALALATDLQCAYDNDGLIEADGNSGSSPYLFSIDGVNFTPIDVFNNLSVGTYEVTVQDKKGCEAVTVVDIGAPEPLIVDAGPDVTVDLGYSTQLDASYEPFNGNEIIEWIVNEGLDCIDCLDPNALSPGTISYVIQVTDENGCIDRDTVTVRTKIDIERPIFAPNIMVTGDNDNGTFMVGTGPASDYVEELAVFDRWGNLIWKGTNIQRNDFSSGWNGEFNNAPVNPAVFAWVAKVHYIDDVVIVYSGDVTVLR